MATASSQSRGRFASDRFWPVSAIRYADVNVRMRGVAAVGRAKSNGSRG